MRFELRGGWRSVAALALIVYALLIYPLFGIIAGHGLMQGPMFGVAPCPTAIFTFGLLLLLASGRSASWLAAIPLGWAAIGTSAAVLLSIPEDYGLGVAGATHVFSLIAAAINRRSLPRPMQTVIDQP